MSLQDAVRIYAQTKRSKQEKNRHDLIKRCFFKAVSQLFVTKKFTIHTLTELIASLPDEERFQLFYHGRKMGVSYQEKASHFSKAGTLIHELYATLGVSLNDEEMIELVAEGFNQKKQDYLKNYAYAQWQKKPYSLSTILHLERELIIGLNLEKKLNNNIDLLNQHSLVNLLLQENNSNHLVDNLCSLYKCAPDYFVVIINSIQQKMQQKAIDESQLNFPSLINLLLNSELGKDKLFISLLTSANIDVAIQVITEQKQDFFDLSSSMQSAVFNSLVERNIFFEDRLLQHNEFNDINERMHSSHFSSQIFRDSVLRFDDDNDYLAFRDRVYEKAIIDPINACAQIQAVVAINAIKTYLQTKPNQYKTKFFQQIMTLIEIEGLSISLLQTQLQYADRHQLFAKMSGLENSQSAKLFSHLYQFASLNSLLDKEQISAMVNKGDLPVKDLQEESIVFLNNKIEELLIYPEKMGDSIVEQTIKAAIHYFDSFLNFFDKVKAVKQKKAEAIYQHYLLEKALVEANSFLIFDPQGHILVKLQLSELDYAAIVKKITHKEGGTKTDLEELLGAAITSTTFCNIDISANEDLKRKFIECMQVDDELLPILEIYLTSSERSSVIALQEELTFHIELSMRVLRQLGLSISDDNYKRLLAFTNQLTIAEFEIILLDAYANERIDYAQINQYLDQARPRLAKLCQEKLVEFLCENLNDPQSIEQLQTHLTDLTDLKFEKTTATGCDYFRTDNNNQTSIRISATEMTSHAKEIEQNNQAIRLLARNRIQNDTISPYSANTVEARVPSIACKSLNHKTAVRNIVNKLKESYRLIRVKAGGYRGPLVYNLLTSLHTKLYDISFFEINNRQRASAARILKGSHLYNREQLTAGDYDNLIYVQNIPVNQHTNELNLNAFDNATAEAALMTEMALLATFNHYSAVFPPSLGRSIEQIYTQAHQYYVNFLIKEGDGEHYFRTSKQGGLLIEKLIEEKANWQQTPYNYSNNLQAMIVQALFKMTMTDHYQNKQFGMLVQTLSIVVEPISQAGCKSANERYQAVAGRVELLKSISIKTNHNDYDAIKIKLVNYLEHGNLSNLAELQETIDTIYNNCNLQGAAAVISLEDQGAASKVKPTANTTNRGIVKEINTNYAETNFLSNLKQSCAHKLQTHKAHLANKFRLLFQMQVEKLPQEVQQHLTETTVLRR